MNDRNARMNLPRIPRPGTLYLELYQDQLMLYSTEEDNGERLTIDEIYTVDFGSPTEINHHCLTWALDAVSVGGGGGFLALGYQKISPTLYTLEGPVKTSDRLMLIKFDDGYQLHDIGIDPPRVIDLGVQTLPLLEDTNMIQIAAMRAHMCGYNPLGYRKLDERHWFLSEALPFPQKGVVALHLAESKRRRDMQLISIIVTSTCLGASLVASLAGVWWATSAAAVVALVGYLLTRPRRRHT